MVLLGLPRQGAERYRLALTLCGPREPYPSDPKLKLVRADEQPEHPLRTAGIAVADFELAYIEHEQGVSCPLSATVSPVWT